MADGTKEVTALKAHLALNVRDVERSIQFYRKMFGIEPSKVRTGYAKFDVRNPPLNFTLNQVPFGERGALSHLGIQVGSTEDVLAVRSKWQDSGLAPRDEMKTDCCYAVQDKAWVNDPDGNSWEVFVVLEDNLPEKAEGGVCCAPAATTRAEGGAASCGCATTTLAPAEATASACCATAAPVTLSR